jgi:hypothetical protein
MKETRRWTILVRDHSFLGWLREKILGTYSAIECDELMIGPAGFFEAVSEDTNQASYFWFEDVMGWCCNKDYKQVTEQTREKMIKQMKLHNINNTSDANDIDMNTLSNVTATTNAEEAMFG